MKLVLSFHGLGFLHESDGLTIRRVELELHQPVLLPGLQAV